MVLVLPKLIMEIRFYIPRSTKRFFTLLLTGRVEERSPIIKGQNGEADEIMWVEDHWKYHPLILWDEFCHFWRSFWAFYNSTKADRIEDLEDEEIAEILYEINGEYYDDIMIIEDDDYENEW